MSGNRLPGRRSRIAASIALALAGAALLAIASFGQEARGGLAYSIELPGTIDPATERWTDKALAEAEERGAELAIVRLDTPGGLVASTREIVKDIIAAPMPVVVYVSPNGARAASAGLFITQAGDVAAMAPQTNIGSATPISIGPGEQDEVLGRKIENDAAAYVRALTAGHGRNADLAERMVRRAVNVTAPEALERGLIDVVASSEQELLAELEGLRVRGPKARVLRGTSELEIERRDMPLQFDLLQILVNPNVAFLLLLIGVVGIGFEVFNPGMIFPGTVGAIALLLGLYGTALLPFTLVGILLLLGGVGLIVAETQFPTSGILGGGGVLALALGGLLLFDTDSEAVEISVPVVIAVALVLGGFLAFAAQRTVAAHRGPVHTGWEEMVGAQGEVRVSLDPVGQVYADGALWRARSAAAGRLEVGDRVRVQAVEGLTLEVVPVSEAAEKSEKADQGGT